MGKSTVLTHLSKEMKQKFPAKWVVRIDLNDHTGVLKTLKEEQIDSKKAIEFVSERMLKLKPGLEMELFKLCCEQNQKVRMVIMFDGFDEIGPFYKQTVIHLLQALRQTAVEQLWVTTRPHLRNELEDLLQQLSYNLQPFTEENQVQFLTKFWSLKDWFTKQEFNQTKIGKSRLELYAEHLVNKLAHSISDTDRELTGIPLQVRVLAEVFDEEVRIFCQSAESIPQLPFQLDLLGLYGRLIERKYDIYLEEKFKVTMSNVFVAEQRKRDLKMLRQDHLLLALKVLFSEEQVALFQNNGECWFSLEQLTRIGIVQVRHDGKPHFIHRTFAEYFVADYLVNRLKKWNNISEQVQNLILKDIFLESEYRVIRVFTDGLISRTKPSKVALKQFGDRIHYLGENGVLIFHTASSEGNAKIIGFLLDSVQEAEHTDTVKKLLLIQNDEGLTAWNNAAFCGNIDALEKLWKLSEISLTPEELKRKLLLATNRFGKTVCHMAAEDGDLGIWQKVWQWAEEHLTAEEINNELLLAKDMNEMSAWHLAASCGNLDILVKIWGWTQETLSKEEIVNKMFLATDCRGMTAILKTASWGKLDILLQLWEWAQQILTKEELKKLLLTTDNNKRTAFLEAVCMENLDILLKIWEWAQETLTKEEINNKVLLATDYRGMTAFQMASMGELDILLKIWEWAQENLPKEEIKNKVLFATDNNEMTAFIRAAFMGKLDILLQIWEWAQEILTKEEINNKVLLAINNEGMTAFQIAASQGNLDILLKTWEWAQEILTKEEIYNKMLLATNNKGMTAFHCAAFNGNLHILQKIWELAQEILTKEEINNKVLLATDHEGKTAWQVAEYQGNLRVCQKIRDWADVKLVADQLYITKNL
jgi:ankyrin repeat protein